MNFLKISDLKISFSEVEIVKGVDINIKRNEIVGIIGPNGSGKSSILSAIAGLISVKSGKIFFKGEDITNLSIENRVKKGIMLVPEGAGVFPYMSVKDNLLMGAYIIRSKKEKKNRLEKILSIFPKLHEKLNQNAGTLSGGERQLLAIARTLIADPEMILLDEPSLGLQPLFVKKIFETIFNLKNLGKTILFVEQNINLSLKFSDKIYIIENGKIILKDKSKNLTKEKIISLLSS